MSTVSLRPENTPFTRRQRRESSFSQQRYSFSSRPRPNFPSSKEARPKLLQASPYTEVEHQLDLNTVDTPNRLLALALTKLEPVTPQYATTPYPKTFNWSAVFAELRSLAAFEGFHFPETEFYVVEFRSQLKEKIDNNLLFTLDKQSHREATAAGGLLKYWFGSPDSERRNLATCLWRGKEDAIEGGKGPWHKQARGIIATTYESINVSGLKLVVEEGGNQWRFEPWAFR